MNPNLADGFLEVDYDGSDLATVEVAVGSREPGDWTAAFLDYHDGRRVAKIRPPDLTGRVLVWLRVNGTVTGPTPLVL